MVLETGFRPAQNSIAESIRIGGWTAGLAIIASNWGNLRELSYKIRRPFPFALVKNRSRKKMIENGGCIVTDDGYLFE